MANICVIQLGAENYSRIYSIADGLEWNYEPDFSMLPKKDFDVVILNREITEEEFGFLMKYSKAHCLFTEAGLLRKSDSLARKLYVSKMGRSLDENGMKDFVRKKILDYYPKPYGEKFKPVEISVSQKFSGSVSWRGFQGVFLEGDYGKELKQVLYWRNNIPIAKNQTLEFWLEYDKDPEVTISLEITEFAAGHVSDVLACRNYDEEALRDIIYFENGATGGYLYFSLKAKGKGKLHLNALHDRFSRHGEGNFIPGGRRVVTADREEIFCYFDPGNMKPPLNVYFSGYKTQEGFEGFRMMRNLEHPFLLISEPRLEGGAFYLGSEEYEERLTSIIRYYMKKLNFDNSQVILSGLSMGTFGALYYGCRIRPHTILIGKPLASLGDVADNERIRRPGGFPTSLDVLYKAAGGIDTAAVNRMNDRFWNRFDQTDWKDTRFAVAYMIEDDYDMTAYQLLQSHLKDAGVQIYGKGLHGRHNDNTAGIVDWFLTQYRKILKSEFDDRYEGESV